MTPLSHASVRNQTPVRTAARRRQPATLFRANNFCQRFVPHVVLLVTLLHFTGLCSRADEVLDCSEGGFHEALFSGEALFIDDCSITITAPISIPESTSVVIDAQGHNVSLSGDSQFLVFEIQSNATLTISGVTITGGQNTNGGALFIYDGSVVVLSNCTLTANQAIGTNGLDGAIGSNVELG